MSLLFGKHKEIIRKSNSIVKKINDIKNGIATIGDSADPLLPKRIENLEKTLEKIDEYELKIQAYIQMAEEHIESKNLSTIEAPEGYRVSLSRLRKWSLMIDPLATDDSYAKRIYLVANCDLMFLKRKKVEFTERIELLKNAQANQGVEETEKMKASLKALEAELEELISNSEFISFANDVVSENNLYVQNAQKEKFNTAITTTFVLGARMLPMPYCNDEHKEKLKNIFSWTYNSDLSRIAIPFDDIDSNKEFGIVISCVPVKTRINELDSGLRNFLFNILDGSMPASRKIYIIDAQRQNSNLAGGLKALEGTFGFEKIPRNEDQISSTLENIVSSFSDIDDTIEAYDSVVEYNASVEPNNHIERKVVALIGWPNAFSSENQKLVNRIVCNYERYGISFVLVSFENEKNNYDNSNSNIFKLSDYLLEDTIQIDINGKDIDAKYHNESFKFAWYPFKGELTKAFVDSYNSIEIKKEQISNEMTALFDLSKAPSYESRAYKNIEIPFGIDSKGRIHSVSFENENFAAYLEGASRSGKSTLLHTLIAGIIMNYHPDNVELWLADFKQLEFENYIKYLPPHIKYVLLDESAELVYDLIDRLTAEMLERQNIFSQLKIDKLSEITIEHTLKLGKPLPVIFVILDEFSIMSQQVAANDAYKIKLQNLLAKGAALGIRFLFSSQTFTTGIMGLTPTARAQIQQRIAMKGSREEITATLELDSSQKTEQVRNWMAALPPHYALVKSKVDENTPPTVSRFLVLYFKDYENRNNMIKNINATVKPVPVDKYDPNDLTTYVDKHPVLVDGRTYVANSRKKFASAVNDFKQETGIISNDIIYLSFGTPRLMADSKIITLSAESRENILMIAPLREKLYASAIITSAMNCALFQVNKADVEVWGYEKNQLLKDNMEGEWKNPKYKNVKIVKGMDDICDSIRAVKKAIKSGKTDSEKPTKKFIVLLGFDRVCSEFEFADDGIHAGGIDANEGYQNALKEEETRKKELEKDGVVVSDPLKSKEQDLLVGYYFDLDSELEKNYSRKEIDENYSINHLIENPEAFFKETNLSKPSNYESLIKLVEEIQALRNCEKADSITEQQQTDKENTQENNEEEKGFYNALEDFKFIVRQGSRFGYHFMLILSNYSDLKQQTALKIDWFRHRMSFQVDKDESFELFRSRIATSLPEHICQYTNTIDCYSFRPFIHPSINWEGWYVDENNIAKNSFLEG